MFNYSLRTGEIDQLAGGTRLNFLLAKEWANNGNEVHLLVARDSNNIAETHNNLKYVNFKKDAEMHVPTAIKAPWIWFADTIRFIKSFERYIVNTYSDNVSKQSVLIAQDPFPPAVLSVFYLSWKLKIPAIIYYHHLYPRFWWHPRRRGGIVRSIVGFNLSVFALTLSKIGRILPAVHQTKFISESSWKFKWGTLRDDGYLTQMPKDGIKNHKSYDACFIGRINANKGVLDLIDIWSKLVVSRPSSVLVIAGPSHVREIEQKIKEKIISLHLENNIVLQLYHHNFDDRNKLLNQSKLFIFPSYEEGWSLSVMEAAMAGTLPVTYDIPAYDYMGEAAIKITVGDLDLFSSKICELLDNEEQRISVLEQIRQNISNYNLQDIARYQLEKITEFIAYGHIS